MRKAAIVTTAVLTLLFVDLAFESLYELMQSGLSGPAGMFAVGGLVSSVFVLVLSGMAFRTLWRAETRTAAGLRRARRAESRAILGNLAAIYLFGFVGPLMALGAVASAVAPSGTLQRLFVEAYPVLRLTGYALLGLAALGLGLRLVQRRLADEGEDEYGHSIALTLLLLLISVFLFGGAALDVLLAFTVVRQDGTNAVLQSGDVLALKSGAYWCMVLFVTGVLCICLSLLALVRLRRALADRP